jgi:hypothetical protein
MLRGERLSHCIEVYRPPFEEFQVLRVNVTEEGIVAIPAQKSPMMLLCLEYSGLHSLVVRTLKPSRVRHALLYQVGHK